MFCSGLMRGGLVGPGIDQIAGSRPQVRLRGMCGHADAAAAATAGGTSSCPCRLLIPFVARQRCGPTHCS